MPEPVVGALERLHCLKSFHLFADLPPQDLGALAEYARPRLIPRGHTFCKRGQVTRAVHFVVEGEVEVLRAQARAEALGAGAGIGMLGLLAGVDEGTEAITRTETLTLTIDAETLLDVLEDHFRILRHLLAALCKLLIDVKQGRSGHTEEPPAPPLVTLPSEELDVVQRMFCLRRTPPFARSRMQALSVLARQATDMSFVPGEPVFQPAADGTPHLRTLLVLSGRITGKTHSHTFHFGPGTYPGMLEAVARVPMWYEAVADEPVMALSLVSQDLLDVLEDSAETALAFMAAVARELIAARTTSPDDRMSVL